MSPSPRLLLVVGAALTTLGPACIPSSNAGRAATNLDSTPEVAAQTQAHAPEVPAAADPLAAGARDPMPEPAIAEAPVPPPTRPVYVPLPAGPYRVRIVDEAHRDLPTYWKGGRSYVLGTVGSRYSIAISNPTSRRVEAVVSVDGLDAVDGRPASYVEKRGYILPAYGDATIDGFRTSFDEVATFRFSSVADSYAGRLGKARDVGVIGVAFFPERPPVAVARPPELAREPEQPYYAPPRRSAAPSQAATDDLGGSGVATTPPAPPAAAGAVADRSRMKDNSPAKRPGLGTEFGEARESRVQSTEFVRANPTGPSQLVAIRYNDRAGLLALGIVLPVPYAAAERDVHLRETAEPFRESGFAQAPP